MHSWMGRDAAVMLVGNGARPPNLTVLQLLHYDTLLHCHRRDAAANGRRPRPLAALCLSVSAQLVENGATPSRLSAQVPSALQSNTGASQSNTGTSQSNTGTSLSNTGTFRTGALRSPIKHGHFPIKHGHFPIEHGHFPHRCHLRRSGGSPACWVLTRSLHSNNVLYYCTDYTLLCLL